MHLRDARGERFPFLVHLHLYARVRARAGPHGREVWWWCGRRFEDVPASSCSS